jgi:tetratricopeptide (TPR) repeat protein
LLVLLAALAGMNTSYDAWAKFDVEQELERVDLRAQQEEQERQVRGQAQAKRRIEDSIAQSSGDAAEVLAAQAAVAALKAKRKGRRGTSVAKAAVEAPSTSEKATGGPESRDSDEDAEAVERLKRQAELLKRKHELLQQIMTSRRNGEAVLDADKGNSKCYDALEKFEAALEATRALEAMLPELLQVQEQVQHNKGDLSPKSDKKQHSHEYGSKKEQQDHDHDHDHHHHGGKCDHECTHNQHTSESAKQATPLPQPTDLKAVVEMFYKDIYLGIGNCHSCVKRHALAAEAFKEVLVRDGSHLRAWMLRGRAFEAMGEGFSASNAREGHEN